MRRKHLSPAHCFLVWFCLGAAIHAQTALTWEHTTLTLPADPKRPTVEAVFPFRNTGDSLAVIKQVMACCDCVKPVLAKEHYAPGEAGELKLVFSLGARTGQQEKSITVFMLNETGEPHVLKLKVNIPDAPVRFSAQSLLWKPGEPADEKSLEIILVEPARDSIESVTSSEPAFAVRLVPETTLGQARLLVRPTATSTPVSAPLRVAARVNGQRRGVVLTAGVR